MVFVPPIQSYKEDFSETYLVYYPRLVRFSQTYVVSRQDAENIVQDVFLHLWERWDEMESLININAFLFMSVRNKCIDYLRKQTQLRQRERTLSELQEKEFQLNLYSLQVLDEHNLSQEEIEAIVTEAIQSLPERCREIFILSRLEGLRYKEIASRLNISVNTVEGQMSIALRKLKKKLKNYISIFLFLSII
jgi:RNA polymerase sigma-70 factor (ECF subfamily)